jgi:hypothetical protein
VECAKTLSEVLLMLRLLPSPFGRKVYESNNQPCRNLPPNDARGPMRPAREWRITWVLMLLCCLPLTMRGASFVQAAYSTPSSATTVNVTYKSAQIAGDLNVVVVGWHQTAATVQSVSDSAGNSYRLAIGPTAGNGYEQSIYYAPNIAGGSNKVTVKFSQSAAYPDVRIVEYQGYAALDVVAGGTGSSTSDSSGSATTAHANELIVGANTVNTANLNPGSGFTQRVYTSPDSNIVEDRTVTSAGSYSATSTLNERGGWVMQMAAFWSGSGSTPVSLNSLSCSSGSLIGAGTDACTVALTAAATTATTVTLSSSNGAVTVPASVTIAAGATSASFTATATAVTSNQTATLTATAGGISKTFALTLNATAPGLTLSSTSVAFGADALNTTATKTVTLTSSGTAPVTINGATVAGTGFGDSGTTFPVTLNPGQTATLTISFDPTTAGAFSGSVTISSNAAAATISLSGTGQAPATLSAISCSSGTLTGAGTDACTVSLTSAASSATTVTLSSSNSAVTVPASVTIVAGATSASFTATATAVSSSQTATLTATAGGISKTFALTLNATAPTLTMSATTVAFGSVALNTLATQSVTMTSSGTGTVTVSAGSVTGNGFSLPGAKFPMTLTPGQASTLEVQFDPAVAGAATGSVSFSSNCSMGAMSINLSGTGATPASYQVELSWDAPTSSSDPVAGYHIYRANSGRTYQLLNSSVNTPTTYTDTAAQDGATYNYEVTSVDASGVESAPSNVYTAVIP